MEIANIYNKLHTKIHNHKYDNWFHVRTETMSENFKGFYTSQYKFKNISESALDEFIEHMYRDLYNSLLIKRLYLKCNPVSYINLNKDNINFLLGNKKFNTIITTFDNKELIDKLIYSRNPTTDPVKLKVIYSYEEGKDIYLLDKNKIDLKLEIGFKVSNELSTHILIETFSSLFINNLNVTQLYLHDNNN